MHAFVLAWTFVATAGAQSGEPVLAERSSAEREWGPIESHSMGRGSAELPRKKQSGEAALAERSCAEREWGPIESHSMGRGSAELPRKKQSGALEYAHGVAALQAGNFENARTSCEAAARALEGDPAQVQQLGRAELCVVDALIGLGRRARATLVIERAIQHLDDGGRTLERYVPELARARGIAPTLGAHLAHVRVQVSPATACPASMAIGGIPIEGDACDGRLHLVDAGRVTVAVSAESFRSSETSVEVAPRGEAEVSLILEPDPGHARWLSVSLETDGAVLMRERASLCAGPCETLIDSTMLDRGYYVVADEEGFHSLQLEGPLSRSLLIERVADHVIHGAVALGIAGLSFALAAGGIGFATTLEPDSAALAPLVIGGFAFIGIGISAAIYGFIVVLTPMDPTYYRLVPR